MRCRFTLLYEESLAKRKRVLGDDHPSTFSSLNNIATLFESKGEFLQNTTARCRFSRSAWQRASAFSATIIPPHSHRSTILPPYSSTRLNLTVCCRFTRGALRSGSAFSATIIPPHSYRSKILPSYSTERVNTTARCRFSRSDFGERKRREDEKLKKKKRLQRLQRSTKK